jgi:hypothetical protein
MNILLLKYVNKYKLINKYIQKGWIIKYCGNNQYQFKLN